MKLSMMSMKTDMPTLTGATARPTLRFLNGEGKREGAKGKGSSRKGVRLFSHGNKVLGKGAPNFRRR